MNKIQKILTTIIIALTTLIVAMFCATILKQRREKSAPIKQDSVVAKGVSISSLFEYDKEDKEWVFDETKYSENTYLNIDNMEDFCKLNNCNDEGVNFAGKVVSLNVDLDFNNKNGVETIKFAGIFLGNDHVISNIYIFAGLFDLFYYGYFNYNPTIYDTYTQELNGHDYICVIQDLYISGVQLHEYGGTAGAAVLIRNCITPDYEVKLLVKNCGVRGIDVWDNFDSAGMVGYIQSPLQGQQWLAFENCYVDADEETPENSLDYIIGPLDCELGGMVSVIKNCYCKSDNFKDIEWVKEECIQWAYKLDGSFVGEADWSVLDDFDVSTVGGNHCDIDSATTFYCFAPPSAMAEDKVHFFNRGHIIPRVFVNKWYSIGFYSSNELIKGVSPNRIYVPDGALAFNAYGYEGYVQEQCDKKYTGTSTVTTILFHNITVKLADGYNIKSIMFIPTEPKDGDKYAFQIELIVGQEFFKLTVWNLDEYVNVKIREGYKNVYYLNQNSKSFIVNRNDTINVTSIEQYGNRRQSVIKYYGSDYSMQHFNVYLLKSITFSFGHYDEENTYLDIVQITFELSEQNEKIRCLQNVFKTDMSSQVGWFYQTIYNFQVDRNTSIGMSSDFKTYDVVVR